MEKPGTPRQYKLDIRNAALIGAQDDLRESGNRPFVDIPASTRELDMLRLSVKLSALGNEQWQERLDRSRDTLALRDYETGGGLVAFARVEEIEDTVCSFHDGMVDPAYQKKGVFGAMLRIGIRYANENGFTTARIVADPGTEAMYKHLGFTPVASPER